MHIALNTKRLPKPTPLDKLVKQRDRRRQQLAEEREIREATADHFYEAMMACVPARPDATLALRSAALRLGVCSDKVAALPGCESGAVAIVSRTLLFDTSCLRASSYV